MKSNETAVRSVNLKTDILEDLCSSFFKISVYYGFFEQIERFHSITIVILLITPDSG